MKKTWQAINKLLTNRKRKSHTFTVLKDPRDNNFVTHNPSRIPNILNEHFATIGNKLAMKLSPRSNFMDYLAKSKSLILPFFFSPSHQKRLNLKFYRFLIINHAGFTHAPRSF